MARLHRWLSLHLHYNFCPDRPLFIILIIQMLHIQTHGFADKDEEVDGSSGWGAAGSNKGSNAGGEPKKVFYETAKFNPRQLIELVDQSVSSCNEAEEEAHLPQVQAFKKVDRMRMRSIQHVDETSYKMA